jgi:hypothetical protein
VSTSILTASAGDPRSGRRGDAQEDRNAAADPHREVVDMTPREK